MARDSLPGRTVTRSDCDRPLTSDEIAALLRVNQALSRHRESGALFTAIAEAVAGVLPADRLVVLVPDSDGAATSVYAIHGALKLSEGQRIPDGSVPG